MDRRNRHEEDGSVYSRLFIVCDKKLTEDDFREAFSKFGKIVDIKMPRDHHTGEPKGVAYIEFAKTSEAAMALEAMHLETLPGSPKRLKVMVACSRSSIQTDDDFEKYRRLFISIPRAADESEIERHFEVFGDLLSVQIQRDRNTGESKGFAYIKYKKFSEAAKALEGCDRKYRPVFAQPKQKSRPETSFETNINSLATTSNNMKTSIISMMNPHAQGFTRVNFLCSPYLNQRQVEMLFDLIPGMSDCQFFVDLVRNCGKGTVFYSNPISAGYAVEKLNNFEYPPGSQIFVKPDTHKFHPQEHNYNKLPEAVNNLKNAITATSSGSNDLAKLAEAIAEASKLIKVATAGVTDDIIPDSSDLNYCTAKLPSPQPLADIDSPVAKRLFLVCKPQPPPLTVLRDVFCRFGNLINVYTLPNKTVGYARYASIESADDAMKTLHGAEICGVRIKVLEADEEAPPKKRRYE